MIYRIIDSPELRATAYYKLTQNGNPLDILSEKQLVDLITSIKKTNPVHLERFFICYRTKNFNIMGCIRKIIMKRRMRKALSPNHAIDGLVDYNYSFARHIRIRLIEEALENKGIKI